MLSLFYPLPDNQGWPPVPFRWECGMQRQKYCSEVILFSRPCHTECLPSGQWGRSWWKVSWGCIGTLPWGAGFILGHSDGTVHGRGEPHWGFPKQVAHWSQGVARWLRKQLCWQPTLGLTSRISGGHIEPLLSLKIHNSNLIGIMETARRCPSPSPHALLHTHKKLLHL